MRKLNKVTLALILSNAFLLVDVLQAARITSGSTLKARANSSLTSALKSAGSQLTGSYAKKQVFILHKIQKILTEGESENANIREVLEHATGNFMNDQNKDDIGHHGTIRSCMEYLCQIPGEEGQQTEDEFPDINDPRKNIDFEQLIEGKKSLINCYFQKAKRLLEGCQKLRESYRERFQVAPATEMVQLYQLLEIHTKQAYALRQKALELSEAVNILEQKKKSIQNHYEIIKHMINKELEERQQEK